MNVILRSSRVLWQPVRILAQQQNQNQALETVTIRTRFYATEQGAKRVPADDHKKGGKGPGGASKEKITLHAVDGSISITSLEDAQKLAKRRGLKLMKETDMDGKSHRPVYRLTTISKIKQEELSDANNTKANDNKSKSQGSTIPTKGDKMLSVNNKIADHDLQSRLKHITKWLEKQHKVIVVISGTVSDVSASEKIFKQMEEVSLNKGRIIQKRTKGSEIRFQILPLPPTGDSNQSPSEAA